ncbi:DNA polymerase III subunit gamma and tau [Micromonospora robiginosa]|uniref:DNA polymerase III subunit gamma/tau n=1 Tax=Micromonospora robiginosa TaxID=2749844 RepID=A0A7L6B972_9ACTN|nr:DNA polymerase III subunit gamma and tau [Micromonospora ferruginea]QLQ38381.1 DNA polymerase III subunit gamma and tau [Micromonospora ferruginea]
MALALYRKYRPRTFAEVIGQEHVTEPLSQALRSGRLNHAYLFSGPRGCGKTSSARILARSLNCEQGPTPEPCGQCESCRSLANDGAGSIDVIEIDAASHGGVDDARELREKAFFAPARSRFKIYVIDEAHMVSSAGFNALLKLVEEPPEYVKFIFATTEPEKVLGTIRSRTHHYPFRLMPPKVLRPYLEQLCEAEGVKVEPAVFPLVVRAGGGSARDSLSVLDQLIAGAGPEGVGYARAAALLGVTDSALIDEMCDALAAGDGAAAYATVDRVAEAGHDPRRFASDLLERLRDLIVLQQVPDAAAKGLIDGPADQIERMAAQAQRLGPATLSRCADIVHNGLVEMRGTTAPRLLLELICARMLLPGVDDASGGLLQRLERMERRLTLGGAEPPAAPDQGVRPAAPATGAAAAAIHPSTAGTPAAADTPTGADTGPAPVPDAPAAGPGSVAGAPVAGSDPAAGASAGGVGPVPDVPGVVPAGPTAVTDGPAPVAAVRRPQPVVMPDPATPEPPRPGAANPGALDAVAVRRVWPEVVGKVNRTNKRIAALMRDAVVRDLDGDTLVLTVKSTVLAKMMADHAAVLTDALYEELGGRWQIRCEVAGERGGATLGGPPRATARPTSPPADSPTRPDRNGPTEPAHAGRAGDDAGGQGGPGRVGGQGGQSDQGGSRGQDGRGGPGRPASGPDASGPAAAPDADEAEDWPEPARPGGATADRRPEPAGPGDAAAGADEWPEPARPGGASGNGASASGAPGNGSMSASGAPGNGSMSAAGASANGTSQGSTSAAGTAPGARATAAQPGASPTPAPTGAPVSSAIAAARAAAAGRGPRTGAGARKTADADWAGEPPYDPDFDGPVRGGAGRPGAAPAANFEGFDPGDEPLDEVIDERTARESSQEQAVRLLREAFGAEQIGEVDAR